MWKLELKELGEELGFVPSYALFSLTCKIRIIRERDRNICWMQDMYNVHNFPFVSH